MPAIGPGTGMLLGGVRCLGYGLLAVRDLKGFKAYRRAVSKRGELFDLDHELAHWGCNHLYLASLLVQKIGFGLTAGLGLGLGQAITDLESPQAWFSCLDEETQCWQAGLAWIESMHTIQRAPEFIPEDSPLGLSSADEELLARRSKMVLSKGSTFHWLMRDSGDLTEELRIRLGLVFDRVSEEEDAIFDEIEGAGDYVDLRD